jgi:chromosome segregation ATPase
MKKLLIGALGIVIGLAFGLVYGQVQLSSAEKAHQAKLKEITQRLSQTQRKFVEERNLETSMEDEKQSVQSQLDAAGKEKEHLLAETKELKTKGAESDLKASSLDKKVASLEARASSLDEKNSHLQERLAKIEADRSALDQKQKQTFQTLQEREKELKQLSVESQRKYDTCAEHNARLYGIAKDLLDKYEHKGVMGSLLEKKPLTQIKKVELEKIGEDYKERIEQQKLQSK